MSNKTATFLGKVLFTLVVICFVVLAITTTMEKRSAPSPLPLDAPDRLLAAIIAVESGGDPGAMNETENAVGLLQIRPIMVRECNRIMDREAFTLDDRWFPAESIRMWYIYQSYWNPSYDPEVAARIWAGGPDGAYQTCTLDYWSKVSALLQ